MMATHDKYCMVCSDGASLRCQCCSNIQYCSRLCQEADWPNHKLLCKSFADFQTRPTPRSKRAILLPVNGKKPEFVWVETVRHDDFEMIEMGSLLGQDSPIPQRLMIQHSLPLDKATHHTIVLAVRDTFLIDGSAKNQCVKSLLPRPLGHTWKGPLVAYGMKGLGSDPTYTDNLDTSDLKFVTNYLLSYNSGTSDAEWWASRQKVKGVIVHCDADCNNLGKERYQAVEVPITHPIFTATDTQSSQIANRLGLPLLARRLPPSPGQANVVPNGASQVTFLHLLCEDGRPSPNEPMSWGWAPSYWQMGVGTTLIVRQDKKPLDLYELQKLCEWCQDELQPLFGGALENGSERSKERVMAKITKDNFEKYKVESDRWQKQYEAANHGSI